jgi:hypothetical protein
MRGSTTASRAEQSAQLATLVVAAVEQLQALIAGAIKR